MHWFVESVVYKDSTKIPNTTCYHITLRSVERGHRMQTWIESRFKNAANWREIVEFYPQGMIICDVDLYDNRRADADSKPQIVFRTEYDQMLKELETKWKKSLDNQ